jgi:hypothetical protein
MALPFEPPVGLRGQQPFTAPQRLTGPQPFVAPQRLIDEEEVRQRPPSGPAIDPEATPFQRGLRSGMAGTEIGFRALAANVAETVGQPEFAKSQLEEISRIKNTTPAAPVTSVGDIRDLSTLGQFASYSFGQAIPTIATAAGGAVAGRFGLRAAGVGLTPTQAGFVGSAAGVFPQEAGQAAARMYESPEAMERSPAQRLGLAALTGAGSAALESVIPAATVGRIARGTAPALEQGIRPALGYVGREAAKAGVGESLTEVGQTLVGQAGMKLAAPRTEELLPSGEELLTAAAAGFLPGTALGAAGSTAEVLRSRLQATEEPGQKFRNIVDTARNPQLNQFVESLRPPPEVLQQGQMAVANWIQESGQMDNVLARAREIAADESLPAGVRERADALVQSGGDPTILSEFTGLATATQRGAEVGEAVRRTMSSAMRNVFGQRAVNDERFSAMAVPLSEADAPLVSALTPYLRDNSPEMIQSAIPVIRDYLVASNDNSAAAMPVNMLSLFAPNQSREGLRAAVGMMQRMGVIGDETTGQDFDGVIDDVMQRQSAWSSLINSNLDPQYGTLRPAEVNRLASTLEALAVETTATPADRDVFMEAVNTAFGRNAPRALERMQNLLPESIRGTLAAPSGVQELAETGTAPLDAGEAGAAPTPAESLAALGLSEQVPPTGEVQWNFANNANRTLYDLQNPEQVGFLQSNSDRLTRSGDTDAVPTGVAEYARLTGDTAALQQAQAAMPDATAEQLNERFKVLGVYRTGLPEAEQIRYDDLVPKKTAQGTSIPSQWRDDFAAIKLYEPGKKAATLVTSPGKIIEQMRNKLQNVTSELVGPEAALSDFTRAVGALMTVEKSGQPAFDRILFLNREGKYVPLSELPDNFTLFQDVSVADAKRALSRRVVEGGVSARPRRWTELQYTEMSLGELREAFQRYAARFRDASKRKDKTGRAAAKRQIDAIRAEVRRRLARDELESDDDAVREALAEKPDAESEATVLSPTVLPPDESAIDLGITEPQRETPGDIEAAELGPRLFQEETGDLLQPARWAKEGSPRDQLKASGRLIYRAVRAAPDSSLKRTILRELTEAADSNVSVTDMRGRIKNAERVALLNGLMDLDSAVFQHRGLFGTIDESKMAEAKERLKVLQSLKFTSLEPGVTEAMSDQEKADVREWLARVIPDATVEFVEQLGGMSGSYSRNALGSALIKINVYASDPLGVAFHEAIHDLFVTLAKGKHQGTLDALQRVASSAVVQRQLFKLLDGNPAAQAQLKDPEEAVAYLFQFWMNDMITIGPQNQSFFNRVVRAVKNFFGFFDDQETTVKVFTAFNEGKLRDPVSRNETLSFFDTPGYTKFRQAAGPITERLGRLTDTVDARFRESNNPYLAEIIDNFNNAVGTQNEKIGFYAAVAQARNRLINQLNENLRGYERADLDAALEALQQETPVNRIKDPSVRAIAANVRNQLDKLYDYMLRKGVTNWEGKPIGKLENYFPRLWSIDRLVADGDQFVEDLLANHSADLNGIARTANKENQDAGIRATVSARDVAESILSKLVRNNGVVDEATNSREVSLQEAENYLGFSPAMNAANERVLTFLDMKIFSKYLEKDLVFAMTQYVNQAVKRAEYSERFGSNGEKLQQAMANAELYEAERRAQADPSKTADQHLPQVHEDYQTYRTGVMALEGTLGHDISNELRQFNSVMMTYQNIRTIPLALLSSFIDPLGIVVRGGEAKQAYAAFKRGLREVMKSWKGEMSGSEDPDVALAEMLGTLEPSSYLDSLGQTYGSMFMTGQSRRINDFFFRLNGMEGWNRAMRTQATVAAIEFIKKLKTMPDRNTERYLNELGLTVDDIVIKEDGSLDLSSTDKRLQFAIMRWVDGAILRPNAAQRPAWASNPKYALLFHLNQFLYSFQKVILERMYVEAKNGNYDPLMVAAAGYIPLMLAANVIRAIIQGGGEEPDWMKDDSLVDWVQRAIQSAGLTGIPGSISDKLPTGLAGPTVQQALDAVFRDQDLVTTIEKALPLQAIYRHW